MNKDSDDSPTTTRVVSNVVCDMRRLLGPLFKDRRGSLFLSCLDKYRIFVTLDTLSVSKILKENQRLRIFY